MVLDIIKSKPPLPGVATPGVRRVKRGLDSSLSGSWNEGAPFGLAVPAGLCPALRRLSRGPVCPAVAGGCGGEGGLRPVPTRVPGTRGSAQHLPAPSRE